MKSVTLSGNMDALPLLFERRGLSGEQQNYWELPGTTGSADEGPVQEDLSIVLGKQGAQAQLNLVLRGLPKAPAQLQEAELDNGPLDPWRTAADRVEDLVDRHVEAINGLMGHPAPLDSLTWRRSAGRRLVCDLGDLLTHWIETDRGDEPRYALIVRLAEELRLLLPAVCLRPRVVLARTRQLQPVARVQQVDSACLRWLVRQPGRTVAEKAGVGQRVMGVVRFEHADTHENRVVKDLVRRAIRASELYLREHRGFGNHYRVETVRKFLRTLRCLLSDSPLASVRGLVGIPGPNYVLQHDRRYSVLWSAYIELVRHQNTLDSAWRWRQRVWSETCRLACLATLSRLYSEGRMARTDVLVHGEHVSGSFIDPETALAPLYVGSGRVLDVLLGPQQVGEYPFDLGGLGHLGPDLTLVIRGVVDTRPVTVVGVWALLHFEVEASHSVALISLARRLAELPRSAKAIVLFPEHARGEGTEASLGGSVSTLALPLPAQRGLGQLAAALRISLGVTRA